MLAINAEVDPIRQEGLYRDALEALPDSFELISNYANFLWQSRKDYDRAEEMFERALQIAPDQAGILGNYATFLWKCQKDSDQAEEMYKRALQIAPDYTDILGNYAQLLLVVGRKSEGMEIMHRAELLVGDDERLLPELIFYRLAHDEVEWPRCLGKMRTVLERGVRSPDWSFEPNIERAEKDGHPNLALLRALAKVVSDEEAVSTLDSFSEWQTADQ